ncbi:hypothetical protein [Xanthomonas graminis]|uniref:hypothetical protein n=1 Tax=Xanthomonas graminis TaxID=3390026 RepID=UPI000A59B94D|nr:hypothetical protein [Xanthomonas translucens]
MDDQQKSGDLSPTAPSKMSPPTTFAIHASTSRREGNIEEDSPLEWIGKRLTFAAGALAAIYAFAYVLGYRYLSEYYQILGAPWAIDLHGTSTIAQIPSPFAVTTVTIGITLITNLDEYRKINYPSILKPLVIATIFLAIHYSIKFLFASYKSYWWIGAAVFGFLAALVACSFFINEMINRHGKNRAAGIILTLIAIAAFLAAPTVAQIKAENTRKSKGTDLPKVQLVEKNESTGQWYLVRATPDGKLLIAKFSEGGQFEFRVIEAISAKSIRQ